MYIYYPPQKERNEFLEVNEAVVCVCVWLLDVCEHSEITTVANDRLALTSQLLREEEKLKLSMYKETMSNAPAFYI